MLSLQGPRKQISENLTKNTDIIDFINEPEVGRLSIFGK
jgi:hypothetical protein